MGIIQQQFVNIKSGKESEIFNTGSNRKPNDLSKVEDNIVHNLVTLSKVLRGAAEILGDESDDIEMSSTNSSNGLSITTARTNIIQNLSIVNQQYVKSIRYKVLQFMIQISNELTLLSSGSVNESAKLYASLANNAVIHKAWVKLFKVVITRRVACKYIINFILDIE
jgi:hypothetical protein